MTSLELQGLITANIAGFQRGIEGAIRSTQQFRQDFAQAARDISTAATRITTVVGGISVGMTAALTKTGFSFDDLKQRSLIAFETMLGSGKKAQDFFDQLAKFAAETPFELRGLMQNVQTMMGMGFQAQQILPLLRAMGDAMAGMGKGGEALDRLVMTFAQMQARGRITGEELRELAHNGIGALQMLADAAGVTTQEMQKMVEKGMVPADFAINVLVQGMNARFGGMMQKMVSTFSGAMSNLKDRSDQLAGKIVEPLFNSFGKFVNDLQNDLGGPGFARIVDGLRAKFQEIAQSFDQFVGQNRAQIIESLGNALLWAANTAAQFAQWIVKSAPAMGQFAQQVWAVLQPIAKWLADNPRLLAGLVALKVTGFLGLNSAIGSTVRLLGGAASDILRFASACTQGGAAAAALRGGLIALMAVGLTKFITDNVLGMRQLRAEMAATEKAIAGVEDKMRAMADKKQEEFLGDAAKIRDPQARARAIQTEIDRAEKNQEGLAARAQDAQARLTEAEGGFLPGLGMAFGVDGAAAERREAEESQRRKEEGDKRLAELKAKRDEALKEGQAAGEAAGAAAGAAGPGVGGVAGGPVEAMAAKAAADQQKKLNDLMEKQRVNAINKEAPGFRDVHKLLAGNPTDDELRSGLEGIGKFSEEQIDEFMGHVGTLQGAGKATPENLDKLAEALTRQAKQDADQAKRTEKGEAASGQFNDRLESIGDMLSPERIAGFQTAFGDLLKKFEDGQISATDFTRGVKQLDQELEHAREASSAAREFAQSLQQVKRDTSDPSGLRSRLSGNQISGFQAAFDKLRKDFEDGKITADKFRDGVDNLRFEMDQAKRAADAQARAEERARHARGDFTQQEVQDAIMDRMIGFQQQQLSQWVDAMLGLNNATHTATQGLMQFGQGLSSIGSAMNGPGGGNMAGISQSIFSQIAAFGGQIGMPGFQNTIAGPGFMGNTPMFMGMPLAFGSQAFGAGQTMFGQGWPQQLNGLVNNFKNFVFQSQGLQNQISFELQRLSIFGIDANSQTDILNTIAGLKQQLASLREPPPLFDKASTDMSSGFATDPGMKGPHIGNIQFNMPNLTKFNQADASMLFDVMMREAKRRGQSASLGGIPLF